MILAAFGDICGNLPALEAILGDIDAQGVQTIVHTGNCVVGYPWPNDVIDRIRDRRIKGPQGVLDRLTVRFVRKHETFQSTMSPEMYEKLEATYRACTSENVEYLRSLPRHVAQTIDGVSMAVFHGTLSNASDNLSASESDERYQRQREQLQASLYVFGGSEEAFHRNVGDGFFVCAGSASTISDRGAPSAHYVLISTESEPWSVEYRAVPYAMPAEVG